jgi:hypothetical protein
MSETFEPLSAREQRLLELAGALEPSAGAEDRVFAKLQATIGAGVAVAATATKAAQAVAGVTVKTVVVLTSAALVSGLAAGVWLGRETATAPLAPPVVIERVVRVEVPLPAAPPARAEPASTKPVVPAVLERKQPAQPQPEMAAKVPVPDELLAKERELIDTARSALLRNEATAALSALQSHATQFPNARLDEERESLWVQALVLKGAAAEARFKAAQFHQTFPRSLLGPTVDAAVNGLDER